MRRCDLEILEVLCMYDGKSEGSQPCCKRYKTISVLGYLGKAERCVLRSEHLVYLTLEAGAVTEEPQISLIIWACQQLRKHCPALKKCINDREVEHQVLFNAVNIHIIHAGRSRNVIIRACGASQNGPSCRVPCVPRYCSSTRGP